MLKEITILGASGLTGSHLLQQTLTQNNIEQVTILVRKKLPIKHAKLKQIEIDFTQLPQQLNELNCDAVFCCLGTTIKKAGSKNKFYQIDVSLVEQLAKQAESANAKRFVVISAQGADAQSKIFYNRCKGEMENKIKEVYRHSQNQLIICQPSLLLGHRQEKRIAEGITAKLTKYLSFLWVGKLKNYQPIEASQLATAMLVLAKITKAPQITVTNRNLHNINQPTFPD